MEVRVESSSLRVCVETVLPRNIPLQLDCVLSKDPQKETMHVQSISHWAPANIGPYSQGVKVRSCIFIK